MNSSSTLFFFLMSSIKGRWRKRQVKFRINDVGKVLGEMKVFNCRAIGMNVKRRLYEEVAVLTAWV